MRLPPRRPESPKPGEIAARRNRPSTSRRHRSDPVAYPLRSPPGIDSGSYPPAPPDKTESRAAPAKYLPKLGLLLTINPPGVKSGLKGISKDMRALFSKAGVVVDSQWKWKDRGALLTNTGVKAESTEKRRDSPALLSFSWVNMVLKRKQKDIVVPLGEVFLPVGEEAHLRE